MSKKPSPLRRARGAWQRDQRILRKKFETPDKVAKAIGVTRQAIWKWQEVPLLQVHRVSELTEIPPHVLRPDLPSLFPKPKE